VIEAHHETCSSSSPVVFVELHEDSTTQLSEFLRTVIGAGNVRVVVDLGERADATSDVLSLLHRAAHYLGRIGGDLAVVAAQPNLRALFDLTLLSWAFPVFATREEALSDWR
jgi:anti-anti-sigma regulatory factor